MTLYNCDKYRVPVIKLNQADDSFKFQALPAPSGKYPYHLSSGLHPGKENMVFHLVGDTGGIRNPDFQAKVAHEMARQILEAETEDKKPSFLFHLGDLVYHHGEAEGYYRQFFAPYSNYPGKIYAIAGNHDSDVRAEAEVPYKSLDAFVQVFCNTGERPISFAIDSGWKSSCQPNVYWTLETPLANIIGLHTNVPKYGIVSSDQRTWFIEELKAAHASRPDKALIICMHHAPYSADVNHGSSIAMISFLESCFNESGVLPDIIFSGHVHNYQRFEKRCRDNKIIPFIVAGAGGFDELHALATTDQEAYSAEHPLLEGVQLLNYKDAEHGFLKVSLSRNLAGILLQGEYYTLAHEPQGQDQARLADSFSYQFGTA